MEQSETYTERQKMGVLALSTVVLGVIVGLSSVVLSLFLDVIEHFFLGFEENTLVPVAIHAAGTQRLLSVTIGGIIAAGLWFIVQTKMKPTVGINKALEGETMPLGASILHAVTQVFYVATGGSVGRELAPREMGALLAQRWEMLLAKWHLDTLTADDRRLLIAAAAGAGFAGIYIAPITGMLFAVEILHKNVSKRSVSVSLGMSLIAMLVGASIKGFHPYYFVADRHFDLKMLPLVIVVGPIMGIAGAYFRKAFQWAGGKAKAKQVQVLWQLPLAALATGIVAYFFPQIMGNGRGLAELAINNESTKLIGMLAIGMILKAVITVFTLKAGAYGGTLAPSIGIGGSFGAILGFAYVMMMPGASIDQAAVIGATALLSASQQAPLMALFMMFEVTHMDYSALLPMGLSVVLAITTSKLILKK
ncbi:chloride channel protein [Weissella cibaria]|uniref:chloride channel protein n=1 Tax=Weissella cibaria TaxID=137591 RepID=UPI002595F1D5|nr:chloride channel protein [uncultured Weissella sp.]